MSASGVREKLATVSGVIEVARDYFGVHLTDTYARQCVLPTGRAPEDKCNQSWCRSPNAVSAGPLVYLKSRIKELDAELFRGTCEDDSLPLAFVSKGRCRASLQICKVARSKMWNTPLAVEPIDITARRVAGSRF